MHLNTYMHVHILCIDVRNVQQLTKQFAKGKTPARFLFPHIYITCSRGSHVFFFSIGVLHIRHHKTNILFPIVFSEKNG